MCDRGIAPLILNAIGSRQVLCNILDKTMTDLFGFLILASLVALVLGLISPSIFSRLFKGRASRAKVSLVFGGSMLLFFILFGLVTEPPTDENERTTGPVEGVQEEAAALQSPATTPVAYKIAETENLSFKAMDKPLSSYTADELNALPMNKRMVYRVVVPSDIKEEQVRPTVDRIISDITSKDNDVDEIGLFLYVDEEVHREYDVARVDWAPGGVWGSVSAEIARSNDRSGYELAIDIREHFEDYLKQRGKTEEKFGLSEDERKAVFREIVLAERRAQQEADRLHPVDVSDPNWEEELDRNISKMRELAEKYRAEIWAKYGINEEVENNIAVEGIEENWPLP